MAYHETDVDFEGPFPTSATIDKSTNILTVEYDRGLHPIEVRSNDGFEVRLLLNEQQGVCSLQLFHFKSLTDCCCCSPLFTNWDVLDHKNKKDVLIYISFKYLIKPNRQTIAVV